MSTNIGYHTRLINTGEKVCGGSFGGKVDQETIDRLVNSFFSVKINVSGRPVFIDRCGREVHLYLHVDPETTEKGEAAVAARLRDKEVRERREASIRDEIASLMTELSPDEILKRLRRLES